MDVIVDGYNVIFKIPELGASTKKCDIEILRNRFLSVQRNVILKFCVIDSFQYWSNIRKKEDIN